MLGSANLDESGAGLEPRGRVKRPLRRPGKRVGSTRWCKPEGAPLRNESLHFVSAREMVSIAIAACDGREGNPAT